MPCGVISCSISDDRFLWKCEFCNKKYHAACVGVQRQREHFITAFMVPMCADCQHILRKEADVRKLLHQQEQLVDAIHSQTDVNHRIAADLKKFCLVSELFDSIEHLLNDVKETLAIINKNNQNMCSAVGQHMKSCDSQVHTTIKGINESNSLMSQNFTKYLDERLSRLTNDMALSMKGAESLPPSSPHPNELKLLEIHEEVKFVSGAISNLQTNLVEKPRPPQKSLQEEMTEIPSAHNNPIPPKTDHSSPGWRFLGNKWHWKQDWTKFDAKQRSRRLQEKAAEKAKRSQKRRKQQIQTSNPNHVNKTQGMDYNRAKESDKQLLATAKIQFAGPPSTTDHPIAALSVPNFINFRKGETINPYRPEKQTQHNSMNESPPTQNIAPSTLLESNSTPGWSLDPMRPPIVSLTQQSADGDGRFLKARLRDPKIMYIVRLYLAYMHDKEPAFCHEGMTNTSIKINLASEGLPTTPENLRKIFFDVHNEYGVSQKAASDDLEAYRRHVNNERILHLQRIRESTNKFHSPSFRK